MQDDEVEQPRSKPVKHSKNTDGNGKHLKLYMHPPSIPTKFQTIHFDDSESKAFNSTSRRFNLHADDLPGPGYYSKAAERVEKLFVDASVSTKGYGVGFASHSRRFVKPPTDLETTIPVSPAQYHPKTPTYSYSLSHSLSPAFRAPVAIPTREMDRVAGSTVPFTRTRWAPNPTPGPGEYEPHRVVMAGSTRGTYAPTDRGAEFVFKSRTSRSELGAGGSIPGKDAPPPGSYDVTRAEMAVVKTSQGAQAAFKATARKPPSHQHVSVLGPGAYEVMGSNKDTHDASIRKVHLRGRVGTIAALPPRPSTPLSTQIAVPGSGMTPIAFPSPGRYEVARCTDSVHRTAPITSSIFVSKSPRFVGSVPPNRPGPGFYHPVPDIKYRSFRLNIDNTWS
ncbi:hypothetical protein BC831DRAFT_490733 [Entophlyctis helioformis]|nr:hypothetical protein BC831DRAFT_490733 [Entophlyctis helioformis]